MEVDSADQREDGQHEQTHHVTVTDIGELPIVPPPERTLNARVGASHPYIANDTLIRPNSHTARIRNRRRVDLNPSKAMRVSTGSVKSRT